MCIYRIKGNAAVKVLDKVFALFSRSVGASETRPSAGAKPRGVSVVHGPPLLELRRQYSASGR